MFEEQQDDGLNVARGMVKGADLAVVFFWLPLGVALAWWLR